MITLINTSSTRENEELVLFQPVLKAYPTCHSWLITAHISVGHLEHHWKSVIMQMDKTCQLLQFLSQQPSTLTQLLAMLQVELTNINDMYISYRPIIIPAINLMNMDPSFDGHSSHNNHLIRSLLPFFGDALSWLMELQLQKMSIVSRTGLTNSLRHSPYNRKLWLTSYPFLTSHSMLHK